MSYWVYLENAGPVEHFEEGGTQVIGGTENPDLNVTYNYSEVFGIFFGWSVKDLHGKKASETLTQLEMMAAKLPNRPYQADYWAPTPGNAGAVVHRLLAWARQYPDGVWRVS